MSKPKNGPWGDPFELEGGNAHLEHWEPVAEEAVEKYLGEAHEALSRLYNKAHKRGKQVKSAKRGESWH